MGIALIAKRLINEIAEAADIPDAHLDYVNTFFSEPKFRDCAEAINAIPLHNLPDPILVAVILDMRQCFANTVQVLVSAKEIATSEHAHHLHGFFALFPLMKERIEDACTDINSCLSALKNCSVETYSMRFIKPTE